MYSFRTQVIFFLTDSQPWLNGNDYTLADCRSNTNTNMRRGWQDTLSRLTSHLLISRGVGCMRVMVYNVHVHCMPYIIDLVHNAFGNVYDFGLWHWHDFWHLDDLGVVFHTATPEGLFNLEPRLWHWALPNHHTVVRRLGGHLKSVEYISKLSKRSSGGIGKSPAKIGRDFTDLKMWQSEEVTLLSTLRKHVVRKWTQDPEALRQVLLPSPRCGRCPRLDKTWGKI